MSVFLFSLTELINQPIIKVSSYKGIQETSNMREHKVRIRGKLHGGPLDNIAQRLRRGMDEKDGINARPVQLPANRVRRLALRFFIIPSIRI